MIVKQIKTFNIGYLFLFLALALTQISANAFAAKQYDAIIVGAGMAGLTAAKELKNSGHSFIVLEATNRIGGRALTDTESFSVAIDEGVAWLHGVDENPLVPIVDEMGFTRVNTVLRGALYIDGRKATKEELDQFNETEEMVSKAMKEAADRGYDGSPAKFFPPGAPFVGMVASNFGPLENATEIEASSNIDTIEFGSGNDDFVKEGIGTFVAKFGKDVPVEINQPVTQIKYNKNGVEVRTAKGKTYKGKTVLVTVSTGVLSSGKITFVPRLPKWKRQAIAGLPMGLLTKVILEFKSDVFGTEKANTWVLNDGPGKDDMAFVVKPLEANAAVGFYGGNRAWEAEKAPDGEKKLIAHSKATLAKIYGPKVGQEFEKASVTHWGKNPWTLGAYSSALPGMSKMHKELQRPVIGRVFFAGEACARPIFNGSLAGAYESGLEAGKAIQEAVKKEDVKSK